MIYDPNSTLPAVVTMFTNLAKYDHSYKAGSIPDLGLYGSYIAAEEMIDGLKEAGPNPTRASFISNLRKVSSYNAGGILPAGTSFANFGTAAMIPPTECFYFLQLQNGKFINAAPGGKGCRVRQQDQLQRQLT